MNLLSTDMDHVELGTACAEGLYEVGNRSFFREPAQEVDSNFSKTVRIFRVLNLIALQSMLFQSALSMLDSGENPNQYSEDGFTPICLAAFWGKSDIVKALLNFG